MRKITQPPAPPPDPGLPGLARDTSGRLLAWYDRSHRDLPWRRDRDPYRIWISEIMLQQTTVKAVVPFYERFLERFPTVQALAEAPLDDVLARWSGLGYYSRARNLHRSARRVRDLHQGVIPRDPESVLALPGIGAYTAAAILSIAHDVALPVVDGNVIRVVSRLAGLKGDPKSPALRRQVTAMAATLLTPDRPGDHNQAMMELGATICAPQAPACGDCPLSDLCAARATGAPAEFPGIAARPRTRAVTLAFALISDGGRYLMVKRDEEGLLAGLWEFPGGEVPEGEELDRRLPELVRDRTGHCISLGPEVARARHSIMNRRIKLLAHEARITSGTPGPRTGWIDPREIGSYGVSSMSLKLLARLRSVSSFETPSRTRA